MAKGECKKCWTATPYPQHLLTLQVEREGYTCTPYAPFTSVVLAYQALAARYAAVRFWDMYDLFCDGLLCDGRVPGTQVLVYANTNHLNVEGARYLAPFWCDALSEMRLLGG